MQITISKRTPRRFPTFLRAILVCDKRQQHVTIRNISEKGALIDGARFASAGDTVEITCGDSSVRGRIAWVRGSRCGIEFLEALRGATLKQEMSGRLRVSVSQRYHRDGAAEKDVQVLGKHRKIELPRRP